MVKISNCPDTGLERFVVKKNVCTYETLNEVRLECIVNHYKDGQHISNTRIKDYVVTLIADNTTYVDKRSGEELVDIPAKEADEDEPAVEALLAKDQPNSIGQFDFFLSYFKLYQLYS